MNDEAPSSSAAPPPAFSRDTDSAPPLVNPNDEPGCDDLSAEEDRGKVVAKKAANVKSIIKSLDMLVYAQLAAVYYMDASLLRFLFRSFAQLLYLTPKPPLVPTPPNLKDRPYIGAIVGINAFCLALHLWFARPAAGEATREYLHGGLMIDFIGQKGPTSKLRLALLDLWITTLQIVMLAFVAEEKKTEKKVRRKPTIQRSQTQDAVPTVTTDPVSNTAPAEELNNTTTQNYDAEEQGVRRSLESAPLMQNATSAELGSPAANRELLDRLTSGQAITAKLYVFDVMRDEWRAYGEAAQAGNSSAESLAAALSRSSDALRRMRGG